MINDQGQKVTADHLKRNAYLYIRQSTLRQVFENTESTKRQYALRERAIALGWPIERVTVIDSDLGQSGASSGNREGFKKLVSEVGLGNAGIVIGLEVSRLARNSSDWHRLLEICALSKTLILDEDGIYNPGDFNDRLLLGLKGTMSEAELHILRARLLGGIRTKAQRGELKCPIPIGFVYNAAGKVIVDPDKQIQKSIRLLFESFRRIGSASGTVRYFRKNGLKFPRKFSKELNKDAMIWGELAHHRVLQILHNPRYAGAFFFGRLRTRKLADGTVKYEKLPIDQWQVIKKDVHQGYISWQEYQENLGRLRENAQVNGSDRRQSPPKEGPALLQGLAICGICGRRMTVRYHTRRAVRVPDYICQTDGIEHSRQICQTVNGKGVDEAIGKLLVESVSPLALEVALQVQDELRSRVEEADRLRKQQVERARYQADLARRRYMQVDPENRLVADSLEADWNDKLRGLKEAQEEYEKQCKIDRMILNSEERSRILTLATNFPRLWENPKTAYREKKRMVRLLIEDVTLIKNSQISIHIRFKGGALKSLSIPAPKSCWELRRTGKEVIYEIDKLLERHTNAEIADILNKQGHRSGTGQTFRPNIVVNIRRKYGLESLYERLRKQRLFTSRELSKKLGINISTLHSWARKNMLKTYKFNDRRDRLYEWPGNELITKLQEEKRPGRGKEFIKLLANRIKEVQCEV